MILTRHATQRLQQRAFPIRVVETILEFGRTQYVRKGESVMLDKWALKQIAKHDNRLAIELERYRGTYVVIGDSGRIVTVAHRTRRLKH